MSRSHSMAAHPDVTAGALVKLCVDRAPTRAIAATWRHLTHAVGAAQAAALVEAAAETRGTSGSRIVETAVQAAVLHG